MAIILRMAYRNASTLKYTNGNLYKSDDVTGSTQRSASYGRRSAYNPGKYKRYADMPLTMVQKKQLKTLMQRKVESNQELKYTDTFAVGTQVFQTNLLYDLTDPPQTTSSATDTSRTGDSIRVLSIDLRWRSFMSSAFSLTNGSNAIRCIVFQYFVDNGANPPGATSLLQQSATGTSYLAPYNHDNSQEYRILYDDIVTLSLGGPESSVRTVKLKPSRPIVNFVGSGTTGTNHIYLAFIADLATNGPGVDYYARVNFTDS